MFQPHPSQRRRVKVDFKGAKSRTEQSHKNDVSIHRILDKYRKTGVIDHVNQHQGTYGNFLGRPDFIRANLLIAEANSMFESVPAHIRKDFDNDAGKFLDFMHTEENREKMEEYGLNTSHLPVTETAQPDAIASENEPTNSSGPEDLTSQMEQTEQTPS